MVHWTHHVALSSLLIHPHFLIQFRSLFTFKSNGLTSTEKKKTWALQRVSKWHNLLGSVPLESDSNCKAKKTERRRREFKSSIGTKSCGQLSVLPANGTRRPVDFLGGSWAGLWQRCMAAEETGTQPSPKTQRTYAHVCLYSLWENSWRIRLTLTITTGYLKLTTTVHLKRTKTNICRFVLN